MQIFSKNTEIPEKQNQKTNQPKKKPGTKHKEEKLNLNLLRMLWDLLSSADSRTSGFPSSHALHKGHQHSQPHRLQ